MWMRIAPCLFLVLGLLGGCGGARPEGGGLFLVGAGGYGAAFDAAKEEIRAAGFELDRIDARSGVITTLPEASSGFATPWKGDDTTGRQLLEGLLNRQLRRVRVDFEPEGGVAAAVEGAAPADLRLHAGPIRARVTVRVDRVRRAGLRPSVASVRLTSTTVDPGVEAPTLDASALGEDPWLAARLGAAIAARAGAGGGAGAGNSSETVDNSADRAG